MRVLWVLLFIFITNMSFGQCLNLLASKLDSMDIIPYVLNDKITKEVKSGQTSYVKLDDVAFKTKLSFLIQSSDLGDTLTVSFITLNRYILAQKKITNQDCILRYEPLKNTQNYFLKIETKPVLDEFKKPITGCYSIAVLERVTRLPFRTIQNIEWK
jgi:hypothetical protein